ncbi:MAG: YceI family protein [Elusimicrobiota bacterium]
MRKLMCAVCAVVSLAVSARAAVYEIDPAHSSVGFKIRHMVVAKTTGKFRRLSGQISYDGKNVESWSVRAVIDAASIDTDNEKRDHHLRAPDFLDTDRFRTLEYASTKVVWKKGQAPRIYGKLTLHGVIREVMLTLTEHAAAGDRAGFSATTTIDRTDFGVNWNKVLDTGGLAVGKEVEITLDIEALLKKP